VSKFIRTGTQKFFLMSTLKHTFFCVEYLADFCTYEQRAADTWTMLVLQDEYR